MCPIARWCKWWSRCFKLPVETTPPSTFAFFFAVFISPRPSWEWSCQEQGRAVVPRPLQKGQEQPYGQLEPPSLTKTVGKVERHKHMERWSDMCLSFFFFLFGIIYNNSNITHDKMIPGSCWSESVWCFPGWGSQQSGSFARVKRSWTWPPSWKWSGTGSGS